ncbi:hypothetical protein BC937DRAFT_90913 [Endogone sp. FLAS-F59071]|nr:hypothetical protein BC937DRAFT_90913 [Endogone sp. FLAS-F59071]|eukprot:RUS21958.1 hypothetical protein BC937DRAFT_90913 [Endogone sp. FLAS-F59071]
MLQDVQFALPHPESTATFPTPNVQDDVQSGLNSLSVLELFESPRFNRRFKYYPPGEITPTIIGFAECGDPDGTAMIMIPDHGCVRHHAALYHAEAWSLHIRMIWMERPGYGQAEPQPIHEGTVLQWSGQIADSLKIERLGLTGFGVGAVYALAIAHKIPYRLHSPIYLISPWVSTKITNKYQWTNWVPKQFMVLSLNVYFGTRRLCRKSKALGILNELKQKLSGAINSKDSEQHVGLAALATVDREDGHLVTMDKSEDSDNSTALLEATRTLLVRQHSLRQPSTGGMVSDILVALEKSYSFGYDYSRVSLPIRIFSGSMDNDVEKFGVSWMQDNIDKCDVKMFEGKGRSVHASVVKDLFEDYIRELRK